MFFGGGQNGLIASKPVGERRGSKARTATTIFTAQVNMHYKGLDRQRYQPLGYKGIAITEASIVQNPTGRRGSVPGARLSQFHVVVYELSNKKRLLRLELSKRFQMLANRNKANAVTFADELNRRWHAEFVGAKELDLFCGHIAVAREHVVNRGKRGRQAELVIQDISVGSSKDASATSASMGCAVKLAYRLWRIDEKHPGCLGPFLRGSESAKIRIGKRQSYRTSTRK